MRLKFVAALNLRALPESTPADFEIRYVDISACGRGALTSEPECLAFASAPSRARRLVQTGDTIVSTVRTYLRAVWPVTGSTDGLVVSTGFAVVTPGPRVDPRYLGWLMQSDIVVEEIVARSVGVSYPAINGADIGELLVPLPDLPRQRAIADYLGAETARIDLLLRLRRDQLRGLAERRVEAARSAFGSAGGTPRLAWMPPLAASWPVVHLRWLVTCLDGRRIPVNREQRASIQGEVPYWGANGVVDHVDRALFAEPLVLLGEDGAPFFDRLADKAFYVAEPIWPNNHIHVLRATGVRPAYLAAYLNLVDYADFVEGSTRDKLTQNDMGSIPVPVPPEPEQRRIEDDIAALNCLGKVARASIERQIDLLLERRQALITAAVTGQIDIPGAAA